MEPLDPKRVREIRTKRLGLTLDQLGTKIGVSPETIRAWESGKNPCDGPPAILLTLLDQWPRVLDRLGVRLPRANAPAGSDEWFELQRILGLMKRARNYYEWCEVVAVFDVDAEWLESLERALLVSRSSESGSVYVTHVAEIKLCLHEWAMWFQGQTFDDRSPPRPQKVPLMPRDVLAASME